MVRVGGEVRGLPAPRDHDARASAGHPRLHRDGRRQVHEEAHRADRPFGVVHEADELAKRRLATQVDDMVEGRVVVPPLTDLYEVEPAPEVLHDLLVAARGPPLDRVVELPAGGEQPEARRAPPRVLHAPEPVPLLLPEVDVSPELHGLDLESQDVVEVFGEAVEEMVGNGVDPVDEGIVTVDDLDAGLPFLEGRQVGIVQPELGARRAHVGLEAARITKVQVPDGRRQHQDVARGLEIAQDQLRQGATCLAMSGDRLQDRRVVAPAGSDVN
jgi:hypothetical protein